jgi:NhaA family Na+:H+ antiporter
VFVVAYAVRAFGIVFTPVFVALGIGLWLCLHETGLHATLAGVAMGLLTPSKPALDREIVVEEADSLLDVFTPAAARSTSRMARMAVSHLEWLLHGLHPWTTLVIVPLFALANAGVALSGEALAGAATSRVAWGVVAGLVVGKTIGIAGAAWLACRFGLASLPTDARWRGMTGVAALGGIGFTVSLFISELAFGTSALADEAKIGILVASLAASGVGALVLRTGATANLR